MSEDESEGGGLERELRDPHNGRPERADVARIKYIGAHPDGHEASLWEHDFREGPLTLRNMGTGEPYDVVELFTREGRLFMEVLYDGVDAVDDVVNRRVLTDLSRHIPVNAETSHFGKGARGEVIFGLTMYPVDPPYDKTGLRDAYETLERRAAAEPAP